MNDTEEEVRQGLSDEDAEVRRRAVLRAAALPMEVRHEPLLCALGDHDWRVRKAAVDVVTRVGGEILIEGLLDAAAQGANVGLRNAAIEALSGLGAHAVARLREAMRATEGGERKFYVEALGEARDAAAVPDLVALLDDDDPNVAASAIDALGRIGDSSAKGALRERLRAPDPFHRLAALDGLAHSGAVVPWEELAPLLSDRLVLRAAIPLLGRCDDEAAVAPLIAAIGEGSPHLAGQAALALSCLASAVGQDVVGRGLRAAPPALGQGIRALLRHEDRALGQAAVYLGILMREEAALLPVLELLADDLLPPRATEALMEWGADAAEPVLRVADRAPHRPAAAGLLLAAELGVEGDDAIRGRLREVLRLALTDREPAKVGAAARGLARYAGADDVFVLVALASAGHEDVSLAAAESLESLPERLGSALRSALREVRLETLGGGDALPAVIVRARGKAALAQLQAGLSSERPTMRRACISALGDLGDPRAAELVAFGLADEDIDVRITAARALGSLRDKEGRPVGVEALLQALSSDSAAVQAAAARALGELGDPRALPPLGGLTRHASVGVVAAALEALAALGDPRLATLVDVALSHRDAEVVKQALRVAERLDDGAHLDRLGRGMRHPAWHVRLLASRLLGELLSRAPSAEGRDLLRSQLEVESDAMVRGALEEARENTENAG